MLTLLAALELLVIAFLAFLLYRTVREDRTERRELLTRIQHPGIVPRDTTTLERVEPEPDESHLIGVVALPEDDEE